MKEKIKSASANASWPLKLDKVHFYSYWHGAFTKEECKKIIKIANKKGLIQGTTKHTSSNADIISLIYMIPSHIYKCITIPGYVSYN